MHLLLEWNRQKGSDTLLPHSLLSVHCWGDPWKQQCDLHGFGRQTFRLDDHLTWHVHPLPSEQAKHLAWPPGILGNHGASGGGEYDDRATDVRLLSDHLLCDRHLALYLAHIHQILLLKQLEARAALLHRFRAPGWRVASKAVLLQPLRPRHLQVIGQYWHVPWTEVRFPGLHLHISEQSQGKSLGVDQCRIHEQRTVLRLPLNSHWSLKSLATTQKPCLCLPVHQLKVPMGFAPANNIPFLQ